jgi:predicted RNase H-like nuclease (RuvC/YqgF family)
MDITLLLSILGPIILSESITYFKVIPELKGKIISLEEKTLNLEAEYKSNTDNSNESTKELVKITEKLENLEKSNNEQKQENKELSKIVTKFENLEKNFDEQKKENKELYKEMQKTLELNTLAIGKLDTTLKNLEKMIDRTNS